MKTISLNLFVAIAILHAQIKTVNADPPTTQSPSATALRIPYGPDENQFADLRLPETKGPFPVAIIVHGGCYLAKYDLSYMNQLAEAVTRLGFATWNLEYRRVGNPGGGWPGTFLDVADGSDHLREIAEDYLLDLSKVIVVGHSSGGQLGIWLSGRNKIKPDSDIYRPDPLVVQTSVALAPVADIGRRYKQGNCDNSANKLMGGSPKAQTDRYRQVSPIEMLPIDTRQIVVLGEQDTQERKEETKEYIDRGKEVGNEIDFEWLKNSDHFTLINDGEAAGQEVIKIIQSLL